MDTLILSQELAGTQTIMELAVHTFGIQGMCLILILIFVCVFNHWYNSFDLIELLLNCYAISLGLDGWLV